MPSSPPPAEAEARLVEGLRQGDEAAFEELAREQGPIMLAVARRIVRNDPDAADVVQEAFVIVYRRIDQFDGRSRLSTWLHRVVVNTALMRLRKQRRLAERNIEDLLPVFSEAGHRAPGKTKPGPWGEKPDAAVEKAETSQLVHEAIAQLPETHRDVLILRDIQELSTAESAAALGIRPGAVKTRLHRARQALRELLETHMEDIG